MSTITAQELSQALALLGITVDGLPAPEAPKPAPKAEQPKAEPRYRSAKQIDAGHERERAIYAAHYAKAGVKRFKDLTDAQQVAAKAEVRTMWKSIKGTRKTSAK